MSEIEFIHSKRGDFKNEQKYLKIRYNIIQQYSSGNIKLQSRINREMASSFEDSKQFEKAISYYNKSLTFVEKGLSISDSYEQKLYFTPVKGNTIIDPWRCFTSKDYNVLYYGNTR